MCKNLKNRSTKYNFFVSYNASCLKDWFKSLNLSSQVVKLLRKNTHNILINGKPSTIRDKIKKGDKISLSYIEEGQNNIVKTKAKVRIVYQDKYIILAYKPSGISTIPSYCNNTNSLANFICYRMRKDKRFIFRALNRLDKDAQGLVLIAKDLITYSLLSGCYQKLYTVHAHGKLKCMQIDSPILCEKKENGLNQIKRVIDIDNGEKAITNIVDVKYFEKENYSRATILLETGRTHQIRLHLSSIGHALIGDKLYGNENEKHNLQLFCNEIYFFHPIKHKTMHFKIDVPPLNVYYK